MTIKIKPILLVVKKRLNFISFCFLMLIILAASILVVRFLSEHLLKSKEPAESEIKTGQSYVNMRLYHNVIDRMDENKEKPLTGIEGLRNPFYIE